MFGVYISLYVCDAYEFAIICPDSRWFWLMSRFVSSLIFPLTSSRHSSSVWFSKIQSLRILHIHCSETCVLNMLFRTFEFWVSGLRVWGWRLEVTIPCQPPTKLEDKEKTPAPATWLQGEVSQRVLNPKRLRFVWLQIMGISINIWYSRYICVKATYLFLLGMGNVHGLPVGVDYVTDFVVGNLPILLVHIVTRIFYGSFPLNEPYRTHFFQGGSRGDSATPRLPEMSRGRRQDGMSIAHGSCQPSRQDAATKQNCLEQATFLISSHLISSHLREALCIPWPHLIVTRTLAQSCCRRWAVSSHILHTKETWRNILWKPGSVLDLIYFARPFKGNQRWRDRIGHGGHYYLGIQTSGCSNHGSHMASPYRGPCLVTFTFLDVHSRRRKWLITSLYSIPTLIPIWSSMIIDIVSQFIIDGLESPIFHGKIYGFL